MKKSFIQLFFRMGFVVTILLVTFLIISLLQIEFDTLRGEINFFTGVGKSIIVIFLLTLSFYFLHYFGKEEVDEENKEHTTAH